LLDRAILFADFLKPSVKLSAKPIEVVSEAMNSIKPQLEMLEKIKLPDIIIYTRLFLQ
jgi:hypothetical protein